MINASLNQISGRISSADTVVDVATVEFRFGAVVLIEKLVFNLAYEKICVAGQGHREGQYFCILDTDLRDLKKP